MIPGTQGEPPGRVFALGVATQREPVRTSETLRLHSTEGPHSLK